MRENIVPAVPEQFKTEYSVFIFRMGGCIWNEAGDLGFKYGRGTKITSVLFDN